MTLSIVVHMDEDLVLSEEEIETKVEKGLDDIDFIEQFDITRINTSRAPIAVVELRLSSPSSIDSNTAVSRIGQELDFAHKVQKKDY
jgi:hypothetical protein